MHDVSNAINILDPSKGTNNGICKTGAYNFDKGHTGKELADHCGTAKSGSGSSGKPNNTTGSGLSLLFKATSDDDNGGGGYDINQTELMGPITSGVISKDVTALNREQKGVVSSAFAKAAEGAKIPAYSWWWRA